MVEMKQAIRFETCLLPALPPSLESVIRRCLRKNREERYASATDLALALRPIVNESFSPFGANSERIERSATASPIPTPRQTPNLAVVEGLAVLGDSGSDTIRVLPEQRVEIININGLLDSGPDSEMTATLRVPAHTALGGTLIMAAESPEPPTVKRSPSDRPVAIGSSTLISAPIAPAPAQQKAPPTPARVQVQMQARVETVRRGVLVVKQPIKFSRRSRGLAPKSKLAMGAVTACALMFGLVLPYGQQYEMAVSRSSTPILDAIHSPDQASTQQPSEDTDTTDGLNQRPRYLVHCPHCRASNGNHGRMNA